MKNKKASREIGIGIIVIGMLFLLGSALTSFDGTSQKDRYKEIKNNNIDYNNDYYIDENYLFYLYETDIGRQRRVTQNSPNLELGSEKEFNTIYIGNNFQINANPFTANVFSTTVTVTNREQVNKLLLYFDPDRISGERELIIKVNERVVAQTLARDSEIPLTISNLPQNDSFELSFELEKPNWYLFFDWNKLAINDLRIVEERQNKDNQIREFDFEVEKKFLERVTLDLTISCDEIKEISESIKATVNGYIILNQNPNCVSRLTRMTGEVPINILENKKNRLELQTKGFYTLAYSIDKVYYNDQDKYKFTLNNFNDIIDVVMYGDFDKEIIDIRLNNQLMSLGRNDIVSIIPYLRFGVNEIEFLTKPLEIDEFVIEKNEFLNFD